MAEPWGESRDSALFFRGSTRSFDSAQDDSGNVCCSSLVTTSSSDIYRQVLHAAGGVAHGLRQSWVGVNGPHQVLGGGFQLHGGDRLGDQVGGRGPDDVHTQDLLVLGVGD